MDSHQDKQEHSVEQIQSADLSRRQIIRGMAAIPVVMTLSNGAAAATQSQLACRATPPATTPECVDPATTSTPAPPFPAGTGLVDTGPGSALRAGDPSRGNQACVVAVAEDGTSGFLASPPPGGVPVTASCYTSFA